jgi:hypothetical protein
MKKIIVLFSITLSLLIFIATSINAELSSQPKKESAKSQHMPKNEQRGSDQFPIVVKVIPPTINAEEASIEKQERKEKQESDWWLIKITAVLALIGALQLVVFGLQARRLRQTVEATKKAAKAAEDAAESLPCIERAYVFVEVEAEERRFAVMSRNDKQMVITVRFSNYGRTPAIVNKISMYAPCVITDPDEPDDTPTRVAPETVIIVSGEPFIDDLTITIPEDEWQKVERAKMRLLCLGRIKYEDVLGRGHETGFCWQWVHDTPTGFLVTDNKKLNYRT